MLRNLIKLKAFIEGKGRVCVCVSETERERERVSQRKRERETLQTLVDLWRRHHAELSPPTEKKTEQKQAKTRIGSKA